MSTAIKWDDVERALLVQGIDPDESNHETALKRFQQKVGIEPTGKPDAATLAALIGNVRGGHAMESQVPPAGRRVPLAVREALRPTPPTTKGKSLKAGLAAGPSLAPDDPVSVMLDRAHEQIKIQKGVELDMLDKYRISSRRYFDGIPGGAKG